MDGKFTWDQLALIFGGAILISNFVKLVLLPIFKPIIDKFLKIEDNSAKIKGLPELIATQQRQIDEINERLARGNDRFQLIEKDLKTVQKELKSNNALLESMDVKLEILVSAQLGIHQNHDLEMLRENYINKKKEQLKG